jgi:hypothetical protein
VSLVGAAVGAYFKRRAENLATHDDLDKLVAQMAAVTATTENIKAAISDDVWDRQEQWKMRRDTVFEVVRALGTLDNALLELDIAHSAPLPDSEELKCDALQNRLEKMKNWNAYGAKFDGAKFLAGMFIGEELDSALSKCIIEMRDIVAGIRKQTNKHDEASQKALWQRLEAVRLAVRKELKLENGV